MLSTRNSESNTSPIFFTIVIVHSSYTLFRFVSCVATIHCSDKELKSFSQIFIACWILDVLTNRPFFDVNNQYTTLFYCGIWAINAVVAYYFISFMYCRHLLILSDRRTTNNSTTYHNTTYRNTVQRNTAQYNTAEHIYQYYTQHPSSVFLHLFLLSVCSLSCWSALPCTISLILL